MLEELSQERFRTVDQHVARRCTHKRLDSGRLANLQCFDLFNVAVCRTEVETVVGRAAIFRNAHTYHAARARRCRLRVYIGHIHEAGYAPATAAAADSVARSPLCVIPGSRK